MYKSPIEIICADMQKQIDNDIYRVTQKYEIKVDKNELIQALQYDRDQYEKGYADGKRDAMAELVRCKDCKHYKPQKRSAHWSNSTPYCCRCTVVLWWYILLGFIGFSYKTGGKKDGK